VKMIKRKFLVVFIFLTACSNIPRDNVITQQSPTPKRELRTDIPKDSWVKLYFEGMENTKLPGLDKIAMQNGFSILRETVLPENDLEIRIWVGFGKYGNDGLILKRSSGNWSAVNLRKMLCHLENRGKYNLESPKSGWEKTWQKLIDEEILTLPDSSKLKYEYGVVDGKSYVVETNFDYLYRTYQYSNPDYQKLKEARQMIKIGEIIADEFGLDSFSIKTGGCGKDE